MSMIRQRYKKTPIVPTPLIKNLEPFIEWVLALSCVLFCQVAARWWQSLFCLLWPCCAL